jgi:rod shape-determining protein MreC
MWRFLQFLARFGNFILFLLLELIAILIIVSLNSPHREISQGMMLEMSGTVAEWQTGVVEYFRLGSANQNLQEQNAELEREILRLRDSLNSYRFARPQHVGFYIFPDSVRKDSSAMAKMMIPGVQPGELPVEQFSFRPCNAVNNTTRLNYNYITIDKGRKHGVRMDMGLISPDGVAGQIIGVSENFALALSVLNRKFRLSAEIKGNQNVGMLRWDGVSPDLVQLDFIPQTSKVSIGDTVLTTGYGTVFPANYMVGTVESFNTEAQDGFYQVFVKLATNFNAIHHLYLVDFQHTQEIAALDTLKSEP